MTDDAKSISLWSLNLKFDFDATTKSSTKVLKKKAKIVCLPVEWNET